MAGYSSCGLYWKKKSADDKIGFWVVRYKRLGRFDHGFNCTSSANSVMPCIILNRWPHIHDPVHIRSASFLSMASVSPLILGFQTIDVYSNEAAIEVYHSNIDEIVDRVNQ